MAQIVEMPKQASARGQHASHHEGTRGSHLAQIVLRLACKLEQLAWFYENEAYAAVWLDLGHSATPQHQLVSLLPVCRCVAGLPLDGLAAERPALHMHAQAVVGWWQLASEVCACQEPQRAHDAR